MPKIVSKACNCYYPVFQSGRNARLHYGRNTLLPTPIFYGYDSIGCIKPLEVVTPTVAMHSCYKLQKVVAGQQPLIPKEPESEEVGSKTSLLVCNNQYYQTIVTISLSSTYADTYR